MTIFEAASGFIATGSSMMMFQGDFETQYSRDEYLVRVQ
jgi:hypothetical protein